MILGHLLCAEDGGNFISTTAEAPPAADNKYMNEALLEKYLLFEQPLFLLGWEVFL
ncbi:hypothetical protein [Solibacillus daqui]|uniref:hypothetical protein n=1 Tax=Solibacillus daqui TaxID=2912187 RepID=UPI002366B8CD|nr:hypothetical protein [Solibacillus daqui]